MPVVRVLTSNQSRLLRQAPPLPLHPPDGRMIDEILEDRYEAQHGHPAPIPFGFNGCVPSPPEKAEASRILSKYSPVPLPVLFDTCRHRSELSHPVLARLAVNQPEYLLRGQLENPARLGHQPEYLLRGQLALPARLAVTSQSVPLPRLARTN
jgi:hypothetical protein